MRSYLLSFLTFLLAFSVSANAADLDSKKSIKPSTNSAKTVTLLDGKLKFQVPSDFQRDKLDPSNKKSLARFSGKDGAWGEVLRGTHGLKPEDLEGYLKKRVDEYSKGLPKEFNVQWLKKEIVVIDGREWADWRFIPMNPGQTDYSRNPLYTRFLTTSYKGQLLEVTFTSNLNTEPALKEAIDRIMDSIQLAKD
jgi:hypothetical protein